MPLEQQPESQTGPMAQEREMISPAEHQQSLMDVWRVLVKQRLIVLTVTAVCLAAAAVYSFRTKPLYQSTTSVEINPDNAPKLGLQGMFETSQQEDTGLMTEMLVLQSDPVILRTALNLNLIDRVRGANHGGAGGKATSAEITPDERIAMIGLIREGLSAHIVPSTQVVEISYRNGDPKLTAEVLNQLVDSYIDEDIQSKIDRTTHVSTWLLRQIEGLKQQASDAQERLADFQKQHNIVGTDASSNLTLQDLTEGSADLEAAEADRITKEARMREFESQDPDLVALMGDNPELSELRSELSDLKNQRAQLSAMYGARYPKLQDLNEQINSIQARINAEVELAKRQVRGEYEGALQTEQMLHARMDAQKSKAYQQNDYLGQFEILYHEAALNRTLYDTLQSRLKEAAVTAGLSATDIRVLNRAQVPTYPVEPRKKMSLLMGLLGGLIFGSAIGFMIESIDDRLRTSEEVEKVSMLPSLATIPHIEDEADKRKKSQPEEVSPAAYHSPPFTVLHNSQTVAAEAYRGLRSALLLSSIDKPPRTIVVTSAFPGEGKTTTAVNCAIVLAQRGERVLLVDADLRRGSLDQMFGLANKTIGLSTVLTQPAGHPDLPIPLPELPTLHVLPTGPRPPNPAEMLSSHRMEEQLQRWAQEFDRVVLDTAPLLAVSDTQAVSVLADAVILVARAGVTRKRALIRARDLLWRINAPVAGVVVNNVDMRLENFYTSRYGVYGSGSKYAYGFQDDKEGE
jgi:capsular exopolysaccharide synthesis family protein